MKMLELKATLEGGTRVSLSSGIAGLMITLRKSSSDQREPDDHFYCGLEEFAEIVSAVRELEVIVGAEEQADAD